MSENKKTPQDVLDLGEVEAIIVTDNEDNVVAIVDSEHIIEHEGYKVIIDKKFKEEIKMNGNKEQVMSETKVSFYGEEVVTSVSNGINNTTVTTTGDGVVISVAKEKTPQEFNQEELIKLCSPIIEFLKKQSHPYHTVLIKEEGVEWLETKIRIPQL